MDTPNFNQSINYQRPENWGDVEWLRFGTLEPRLQFLLFEVNKRRKITILCGARTDAEQLQMLKEKKSKVGPDQSKHCTKPLSFAADIGPDPYTDKDLKPFYWLGGYVKGLADALGIPLRWGGDFNRNYDSADESFLDLVHFEIDEQPGRILG